jgi:hypothetical protein
MTINHALLLEQLYYTDRHIAACTAVIEKERQGIAQLEAKGDSITLANARTLLAQMERAHAGYIADRGRIRRLLDR